MFAHQIQWINSVEESGPEPIVYKLGQKWFIESLYGVELLPNGVKTKDEAVKAVNDYFVYLKSVSS